MTSEGLAARTVRVIESRRAETPAEEVFRSLRVAAVYSGGHNVSLTAEGEGRRWFIKFCRPDNGRVPEICERELLISLLGEILEVPTVKAWVIPAAFLTSSVPPDQPNLIRDRFVLMPFLEGSVIEQVPDEVAKLVHAEPAQAANLFAFMHWIGDEDRGLTDVILSAGRLVLIDNGLCGPGRDAVLRGAHPAPDVYRSFPEAIVKKCYPGKPSFVAQVLRDSKLAGGLLTDASVLKTIEALSAEAIASVAQAAGVPDWIADVLFQRCALLRRSYQEWLSQATQVCAD